MGKKSIKHIIKLKIAKADDLIEIDRYKKGGKKKMKMREGMPYWLFNSKGKIENKNYILNKNTDAKEIGDYLARQQILILK